jgi:hypothetical protein
VARVEPRAAPQQASSRPHRHRAAATTISMATEQHRSAPISAEIRLASS